MTYHVRLFFLPTRCHLDSKQYIATFWILNEQKFRNFSVNFCSLRIQNMIYHPKLSVGPQLHVLVQNKCIWIWSITPFAYGFWKIILFFICLYAGSWKESNFPHEMLLSILCYNFRSSNCPSQQFHISGVCGSRRRMFGLEAMAVAADGQMLRIRLWTFMIEIRRNQYIILENNISNNKWFKVMVKFTNY